MPVDPSAPVRVGVSSCLLGEEVRYDGRHKHQRPLTGMLAERVQWVPVCPEIDIGLGVPREPIHLLAGPGEIRLAGVRSATEHTASMRDYAERQVDELLRSGLDGYVLKSRSPSCGLGGVPVHDPTTGEVVGHDRGRFAAVLVDRIPDLPVIEERRFTDTDARDRFLERVCVRHRWRRHVGDQPTHRDLIDLHQRHEMQVLAHSPRAHRDLASYIARSRGADLTDLADTYRRRVHEALDRPTTVDRHSDVLHRLVGMLGGDHPDLREVVAAYADGEVAWVDAAERLRRVERQAPARFRSQTYLDPLAEVGLAPASW